MLLAARQAAAFRGQAGCGNAAAGAPSSSAALPAASSHGRLVSRGLRPSGPARRLVQGKPDVPPAWASGGRAGELIRRASTAPHAAAQVANAESAAAAPVPSPLPGPAAAAGITDPATFVVVNFYHLVDVAEPGKV